MHLDPILFVEILFDNYCIFLLGRLVLDADNIPMVVPFVHSGMQDIMPIGASIPRIGKTVGSPILKTVNGSWSF